MTSPLLALFIRSVREDSRLKFTYFSRAALVSIILLFLLTARTGGWGNAPGLRFFGVVVGIDLCFVVLAALSYFSSAITEEKEEMTLGLLRMTNLNPLSILLGKSTSRLCTALLLFSAQVPFTLLAITLGGISLTQIAAAYCSIGAFLIFVCNLALFTSVLCRRSSLAAVLTGVGMLFFLVFLPAVGWLGQLPVQLGYLPPGNDLASVLESMSTLASRISPFTRMSELLTTGFHGHPAGFQVLSNLALALAFFVLSWLVFEKFCGEQKETAPGRAGVARSRGRWRILSPGRPWAHALAWKDFYFTTGGKLWVLIKLVVYGAPLVVVLCWPQQLGGPPSSWEVFGVGMFWTMLGFAAVELTFAAGSIFSSEHHGQTLSSLAVLPQGLHRAAYQKLLGIVPALFSAGFYFVLSLPLVTPLFRSLLKNIQWNSNETWDAGIGAAFAATQGFFFLHLVTLLSLYVKRGALAVAVGIQILELIFVIPTVTVLFRDISGVLFLALLTAGAAAFLHFQIGRRLEALAAEG